MAADDELLALMNKTIPDGRKGLQENYTNLENVARFCEDNYFKAPASEKARAFQETKDYTTQSVASVAYQIHNLATNFLQLLDLQFNQLTDLESSVNHMNQVILIHKEKVARREIGILTEKKKIPNILGMKNGIIYPEIKEAPVKYTRTPIDYTALDNIGHGLRQQPSTPQVSRRPSALPSTPQVSRRPSAEPGTPQVSRRPSAEPSTPQISRHPSSASINRNSMTIPQTPTIRPPVSPGRTMGRSSSGRDSLPPPPDMPRAAELRDGPALPPPPPPPLSSDVGLPHQSFDGFMVTSPPPPSPPSDYQVDVFNFMEPLPKPHNFDSQFTVPATPSSDNPYAATGPVLVSQPSWAPEAYLEKVVAIYDYQADKPDELSFSENAVIYVINKNLDGWWEGMLDGRKGLFPYNYVEPCM